MSLQSLALNWLNYLTLYRFTVLKRGRRLLFELSENSKTLILYHFTSLKRSADYFLSCQKIKKSLTLCHFTVLKCRLHKNRTKTFFNFVQFVHWQNLSVGYIMKNALTRSSALRGLAVCAEWSIIFLFYLIIIFLLIIFVSFCLIN